MATGIDCKHSSQLHMQKAFDMCYEVNGLAGSWIVYCFLIYKIAGILETEEDILYNCTA